MGSDCNKVKSADARKSQEKLHTYRWNMIHCATVTMLSWVSLSAESLARTPSSVYAMA